MRVTAVSGTMNGTPPPENANRCGGDDASPAAAIIKGLGGFGHKKKDQEPAQPQNDAPGVLMEMTTEFSNFSSGAVDLSKFEVPVGFRLVKSEMNRKRR